MVVNSTDGSILACLVTLDYTGIHDVSQIKLILTVFVAEHISILEFPAASSL